MMIREVILSFNHDHRLPVLEGVKRNYSSSRKHSMNDALCAQEVLGWRANNRITRTPEGNQSLDTPMCCSHSGVEEMEKKGRNRLRTCHQIENRGA